MQLVSALTLIILLFSAATLVVVLVLLRRGQMSVLPETILQIPDRVARLEVLQDQLVSSVREGFRDSRGEISTSMSNITGTVERNLEKVRIETATLKSETISQMNALTTLLPDRLSVATSSISENFQNFTDAITAKVADANASTRTEIQLQIGAMQAALTASFTDLSTRTTEASSALSAVVHSELDTIGRSIKTEHETLRTVLDNNLAHLRRDVTDALGQSENKQTTSGTALQETLDRSFTRLSTQLKDSLDVQGRQLSDFMAKTDLSLAAVKASVEQKLASIAEANEKKLEQMRETVDEKLHSTLEKRLADSFSAVSDQLGKVQTGLGEMKDLASSVGDLKKVFTNVKSRGGFAEVQLGAQLSSVLAPNQYKTNARIKPDTSESVEYAVCFPGNGEECLLPIDAKFPKEPWERLEAARDAANVEEIKRASNLFESTIRTEAKRISEKYINPPATTNFAYMYLPTESLFSEAVRNPALIDEIQTRYRVSVAGPTTLMALLISFQMGFQTLAIQRKGSEVWNVLGAAKTQFGKFGELMTSVEKKVGTVQKTLQEIGTRTRVINRTLSGVDTTAIESTSTAQPLNLTENLAGENDGEVADGAAAGN
jgi:DNA recombination protein RmuC